VLSFCLINIEIADFFSEPGRRVLAFQFSGNFARDMTYTIAWALFALGLSAATFRLAEGAATGFFLLFVLAALVRSRTDEGDVVMLAGSTVSYFGFSMLVLTHFHHEAWRGLFTFGLGSGLAVLGGAAGLVVAKDALLRRGLWGLSVAATTLAIPLQFYGFAVAIGWALEGVALSAIGTWAHSLPSRLAGGAVAAGGALVTLSLLFGLYAPSHVVISVQSRQGAGGGRRPGG